MPNIFEKVREERPPPTTKSYAPSIEKLEKEEGKSPIFQAAKQSPIFHEEKPSFLEEAKRNTLRLGSRGLETLATAGGRAAESPVSIAEYGYGRATGKKLPGADAAKKALRLFGGAFGALTGGKTREEVKEFTSNLTQGYLDPQSPGEALADTIFEDAVDFMVQPGKISLFRPLLTSVVSNTAGESAKKFGFKDQTSQDIKLVTSLLISLNGRNGYKGVEKFGKALYNEADHFLTPGQTTATRSLVNDLNHMQNHLNRGGLVPSKTSTLKKIDEIKSKASSGSIEVKDLTEFKKSINELRSGLYKEFQMDKVGRKLAKKNLDDLSRVVDKSLESYGQYNPQWYSKWSDAQKVHGVIAQSNNISGTIYRNLKPYMGHGAMGLVLESIVAPVLAAKTVGGLGAGMAAVKTAELAVRICKDSKLRTYYSQLLKDASSNNVAALRKSADKLNQALEKDDEIQKIMKKYEKDQSSESPKAQ